MGYHSQNLLDEPDLSTFAGAILSPADYDEGEVARQVERYQNDSFECIFDPQLYFPNTYRRTLKEWSYFPSDVDSADISSPAWWSNVNARVCASAVAVGVRSVCSPVVIPRRYSLDYLRSSIDTGNEFQRIASPNGLDVLQTVVIPLDALAEDDGALQAASVLAQGRVKRVYLVFLDDLEPRRERSDVAQLTGAQTFISELSQAGLEATVGFCSTDMILFKSAGAINCCTGKFLNLRRFSSARFSDPDSTGRQVPYFVEEGLLAFLREPDILRLRRAGVALSDSSSRNPYTQQILDIVTADQGLAWIALSWKHYMAWFADAERRVTSPEEADSLLEEAERKWVELGTLRPRVLMAEPQNDGAWLRSWRISLSPFLA